MKLVKEKVCVCVCAHIRYPLKDRVGNYNWYRVWNHTWNRVYTRVFHRVRNLVLEHIKEMK